MPGRRPSSRGGKLRHATRKKSPKRRGPRRKNVCQSCKNDHLRCEPVPPNDIHSPLCKRCMDCANSLQVTIHSCSELTNRLGNSVYDNQALDTPEENSIPSFGSGANFHMQPTPAGSYSAPSGSGAQEVSPDNGDTLAAVPPSLSQAATHPYSVDYVHGAYNLQTQPEGSQSAQGVNPFPGFPHQTEMSYQTATASSNTASLDRSIQSSSVAQWSDPAFHPSHFTPHLPANLVWPSAGVNSLANIRDHPALFANQHPQSTMNANPSQGVYDTSERLPPPPTFGNGGFTTGYERRETFSPRAIRSNTTQAPSSLNVSIPTISNTDAFSHNTLSSAASGSFPFTPGLSASASPALERFPHFKPITLSGRPYMDGRGAAVGDTYQNSHDNVLVAAENVPDSFYDNMKDIQPHDLY